MVERLYEFLKQYWKCIPYIRLHLQWEHCLHLPILGIFYSFDGDLQGIWQVSKNEQMYSLKNETWNRDLQKLSKLRWAQLQPTCSCWFSDSCLWNVPRFYLAPMTLYTRQVVQYRGTYYAQETWCKTDAVDSWHLLKETFPCSFDLKWLKKSAECSLKINWDEEKGAKSIISNT